MNEEQFENVHVGLVPWPVNVATTSVDEAIRKIRSAIRPTPVERGFPEWFKHLLPAAAARAGVVGASGLPPAALLESIINSPTGQRLDFNTMLDHVGTTSVPGCGAAFVAEPYGFRPEALAAFTRLFQGKVKCYVTAYSWHFPGATFRILWLPAQNEGEQS